MISFIITICIVLLQFKYILSIDKDARYTFSSFQLEYHYGLSYNNSKSYIFACDLKSNLCLELVNHCSKWTLNRHVCLQFVLNYLHFLPSDSQELLNDCINNFYQNVELSHQEISLEENRLSELKLKETKENNTILKQQIPPYVDFALFVTCHDESSKQYTDDFCSTNNWSYPLFIDISTKYFESIVYKSYLPINYDKWKSYDYVILTQYKVIQSIQYSNNEILRLIDVAYFDKYDVIPIVRTNLKLITQGELTHGQNFTLAWYALLEGLGYPREIIKEFELVPLFTRNSFIIKTNVLKELCLFMNKAIEVSIFNETVSKYLSVDSYYIGGLSSTTVSQIFGVDYYQLHPFIFERLPIFYFYSSKLKICHGNSKCKFNQF